MSTVVEEDGKKIMLLKGASEIVLSACNKWMVASTGEVKEINGEIL